MNLNAVFFVIQMFRFSMLDVRTELSGPRRSQWADVESERFIGCLETKLLTITDDFRFILDNNKMCTLIILDPGAANCGIHLQHL